MYAECLNELTQGQSYQQKDWKGNDIVITGRDISEMKRGIRPVRIRAGLPDYTDGIYNSQDDLRAKIKRERMIEFMGEGKRYFDLRRWMDAPVEENKRVYGLNVFQTAQNRDEFMQVIPVYNWNTGTAMVGTIRRLTWVLSPHEVSTVISVTNSV